MDIGDKKMISEVLMEKYLEALLTGDRRICRTIIEEVLHQKSASITGVYCDVIWPVMVEIDKLCDIVDRME